MKRISVCASIILLVQLALGQTDRGTITGSVSDPAQAAVPAATVIARHLATANVFRTATTETGLYTLPSLPSGDYSLQVEKDGFKRFTQSPIHVDVAKSVQLDVVLTLGAASESITVAADASMLQETSDYSLSMDGQRMNDLPLNFAIGAGRDPQSLWLPRVDAWRVQRYAGCAAGEWLGHRYPGERHAQQYFQVAAGRAGCQQPGYRATGRGAPAFQRGDSGIYGAEQ